MTRLGPDSHSCKNTRNQLDRDKETKPEMSAHCDPVLHTKKAVVQEKKGADVQGIS